MWTGRHDTASSRCLKLCECT